MYIIVGLGNIGDSYRHTYHNMGFLAVEALAKKLKTEFAKKECDSVTAHASYNGQRVILAKPQTYMNRSGTAVSKLLKYYKCSEDNLIVLYDDIDITKGEIRYREAGSSGTHNGMRDIVFYLGENFKRVRIGIGRPENGRDLANYVLSAVPSGERDLMVACIDKAVDKVIVLMTNAK